MKIKLFILPALLLSLYSCKKEGPGGSSSINGTVKTMNHVKAKEEITEIIFTNGLEVEHGDYFLLNTANDSNYYYVWYDNPTWVSNGDPMLAGRTGISVSFNYSDSNIDIAGNTMTEISNYCDGNFTFNLLNDILVLTNTVFGEVPDADKVTSPFEFNTNKQGRNSSLGATEPLVDEKVYLVYGNGDYSNEDTRTGLNGEFQFTGLTKGNYMVYTASKDTLTGLYESIEVNLEITSNKSANDLGTINVLN